MNVTVFMGNPRKDGYSQQLADLFVRGLKAGNATVTVVDLAAAKINQCIGCYHCWLVTPGICIHHDDMPVLMDSFCSADSVVLVSPLYAFSVSACMKTFLDRLLAWTREGFVETPSGLLRNTVRRPDFWPSTMAGILAGAFRGEEIFLGAKATIELLANGLGLTSAGVMVRPESYLLPFAFAKPKTVKIIEQAFEQAGFELATHGTISSAVIEKGATPLSADNHHFQKYSNIFWEHARRMGKEALDLGAVRDRVVRDMRVLLSEMVRSVDRRATAGVRAVLQFNFSDTGSRFAITVDKGTARLDETEVAACDLCITTTTAVWAGVFMRTENVRDALANRSIILEGNKFLFSRLDRYFPPPNT
jgi:hypothetical protein